MRVLRTEALLSCGDATTNSSIAEALAQIRAGIELVAWPVGASRFTIRPVRQKNGVRPVKEGCMAHLRQNGWDLEKKMDLATRKKPGKIDAVRVLPDGRSFAFEWETGNISSSHRALSKMAVGLIEGVLAGGVLAVPSRRLYNYLTDRIGNFPEIEPYFPLYRNLNIEDGYLAVIEFEHDDESDTVPLIPKGTDGRAQR